MRPVKLSQLARWCEGRLLGADVDVRAISIDTRSLVPGSLFVALRGARVDGHDLFEPAQAAGAVALLVARPVDSALPQIQCADPQEALGEIAAHLQKERTALVLAMTGSNGKTSVKAMTESILTRAGRTYVNPGNRNNEIGLPLAVIDAPEDAQFAVYEMGAGKPGDIAYLTTIAPPRISLVNNIMPAHIERMGSLLGIAETKGAIYEALPDDGIGVVNADDAFAPYFMQRIAGRAVIRFGLENSADVRASSLLAGPEGTRFQLHTPAGQALVTLPMPGRHNVMNALAASAMALAAGVSLDVIVEGLQHAAPVAGRQVPHTLRSGVCLIDDSYNANPGSVAAAIASLADAVKGSNGEAWLVLGDMGELGEAGQAMHAHIGEQARSAGIAQLWTAGPLSAGAARAFGEGGHAFTDQTGLLTALLPALSKAKPGLRCLVKGSRSSAMDRIVAAVLAADAGVPEGGSAHVA